MRIRICVGVLPNGKWAAEGSSDGDDASAEAVVRFTLNKDCTIHWVEANIPEPVVIEGEVDQNEYVTIIQADDSWGIREESVGKKFKLGYFAPHARTKNAPDIGCWFLEGPDGTGLFVPERLIVNYSEYLKSTEAVVPWSPRFKIGDKVQQPTQPWTYIVTKEATAPHDHFIAVESASDWEDGYPTTLEDACMQLHTGEIFDYIFPPDSTTLVTKIGEAE